MSFTKYPEYIESGIDWLGPVPITWLIQRSDAVLKSTRRQIDPSQFAKEEVFHYSIPSVQEIGTGRIEDGSEIASAKQLIDKKVVLVSKLNPRKATTCIAEPKGRLTLCSTEFVSLEPKNLSIEYLAYLVQGEGFRQSLESKVMSVTNSHQRAEPSDIYRFWMALPSQLEQQKISTFLDRETAKIDALVAEQERLIELLEEKRQAVISHAVTKGLDPTTPMKNSGMSWLGTVPSHWIVMTVRRVARRIQAGSTPPTAMISYFQDGTVPWFGPSSFDGAISVKNPVKLLHESAISDGVARLFGAGATLVVTIGATLGKVSSLPQPGSTNQQITAIEFDPGLVVPLFGSFQIRRLENTLRAIAPSATLPILTSHDLAEMPFVLPPSKTEQEEVVRFINDSSRELDRLAAEAGSAIALLHERRSALISAAVTGQIDVRQHEAA